MPEKEKYHIFDLLLWVLKVDIYSYQMFWINIDLASCGYEDLINMADFNPILSLCPIFTNQKIGSLLVY